MSFDDRVELSMTARVGNENVSVQVSVSEMVYADPEARRAIEARLTYDLMTAILERWKPKIRVRR